MELPGTLMVAGRSEDCRILDLSVSGAGVELDSPPPRDALVRLAFAVDDHPLDVAGMVVRSHGRHAGIIFWTEPPQLGRLLAAAQRPDLVRGVRSGYERRARVSWSFLPSDDLLV